MARRSRPRKSKEHMLQKEGKQFLRRKLQRREIYFNPYMTISPLP
jgi:hypothetical protein